MSVLPDELISSLKKLGHFDEPAFRAVHASGEQAVSVRFNPAKIRIEAGQWPAAVSPPFRLAERIPWSETGYYLSEGHPLPSIRFFMPGPIMCRKLQACSWSRPCGR
jgi:hypothetical protein